MANEIIGCNSYLTVWPEAVWGTKPETPAYAYLPVTDYGVKLNHTRRNNTPYHGGRFRKHGATTTSLPSGTIGGVLHPYKNTALTKTLAEFVLNLAFGSLTGNELPSFGAEFAEGPNISNKAHYGLRCDQMTITGSAQQGNLSWSGNFSGKTENEAATAQTVPNDLEKLIDYAFPDIVLEINSVAVPISQFQIQRTNTQLIEYLSSRTPTMMKCGMRLTTLNIEFVKNAVTYDAFSRAMAAGTETELDISIVMLGDNNGTGTDPFSRITIDIPRAQLTDVADTRSVDQLFKQGLPLDILKPDTSDPDIAFTFDEYDPDA